MITRFYGQHAVYWRKAKTARLHKVLFVIAAWRISVEYCQQRKSARKFAIASGSALSNLLLVMAQIAQLVLASVALLVVLQTCQAQQGYVGKFVCVFTLFYACVCALLMYSVCYQRRSQPLYYRTSTSQSYTSYYGCWWSRCSRYGKISNTSRARN